MERIINLERENIDKILKIVNEKDSVSTRQSIEELSNINGEYLSKYCFNYDYLPMKQIVFSNGVTKSISTLRGILVRKDYIKLILNIPIFGDSMEEETTFLGLTNLCLERNLIKKQNIKNYTIEDLELLYDLSRTRKNEGISDEKLFIDFPNYNKNSRFKAFTLRNECIRRKLLDRSFFYRKLESIEYYENILKYTTHIIHGMKTYMRFEAILKGFPIEGVKGKTYWEFLTKQDYPSCLKNYLYMQETKTTTGKNLVEVYNEGVLDSFDKVSKNINFMYERRDFYDFRFRNILSQYYLKVNSPDTLKKFGDRSKYTNFKKFDIAIDSLGI